VLRLHIVTLASFPFRNKIICEKQIFTFREVDIQERKRLAREEFSEERFLDGGSRRFMEL
jgi:hypothetical protein